jgi:tetratricopeptide (TPR) repeat protein
MLNNTMSRQEIEEILRGKGDYIQIDLLTKFLEEKPPVKIKKFVYSRLAEIYNNKKMFGDSAKMFENLAVISISFSEKTKYFVKAVEYYIKDGFFEKADYAMNKAIAEANEFERGNIYYSVKEFYKKQAERYEDADKRNQATKIYEKLLGMKITEYEKKQIKKKLLNLYEKLGKFKEHGILKGEE